MPLDWQFPLVPFGQSAQPQSGSPSYNPPATGPKLAADGFPDDWFVPPSAQGDGFPDDWFVPPSAQGDGFPDDWFVPPSAQGDGFPDDWFVPPAAQGDGFPDDWFVPPSAQGDGFPDDWVGPVHRLAADGYPDDWFVPGQTSTTDYRQPGPQAVPPTSSTGNSAPGGGSPNMAWSQRLPARPNSETGTDLNNWATPPALAQPSSSTLVAPVNYQAGTRPWWIPMGPGTGWEPWADQFIKGMQGLINFLRSRGGGGVPRRGDDEDCYTRWEQEDGRCEQFRPFGSRYLWACKTRANDRRSLCIRNGGQPDPDEPSEYDWNDIMRDSPGT